MYQVLVYQLNNAASESMFSDTQIYENINRLVNLIGYHPRGCRPSQLDAYLQYMGSPDDEDTFSNSTIPPFSYIDTGLVDQRGEKICFSLGIDDGRNQINQETEHQVTLYNGRWRYYGSVFTSSGAESETFVLSDIKSDSAADRYVANNFIKAVVVPSGSDTP